MPPTPEIAYPILSSPVPELLFGDDPISGMTASPEVFAKAHTGAEGGWRRAGLEDEGALDEEAVVAEARYLSIEPLNATRLMPSMKAALAVGFPKPPTEGIIRSEEGEIATESSVPWHVVILRRIRPCDLSILGIPDHNFEEATISEVIVGTEEAENVACRFENPMALRFFRITFRLNEDFIVGEGLACDGDQEPEQLGIVSSLAGHDNTECWHHSCQCQQGLYQLRRRRRMPERLNFLRDGSQFSHAHLLEMAGAAIQRFL